MHSLSHIFSNDEDKTTNHSIKLKKNKQKIYRKGTDTEKNHCHWIEQQQKIIRRMLLWMGIEELLHLWFCPWLLLCLYCERTFIFERFLCAHIAYCYYCRYICVCVCFICHSGSLPWIFFPFPSIETRGLHTLNIFHPFRLCYNILFFPYESSELHSARYTKKKTKKETYSDPHKIPILIRLLNKWNMRKRLVNNETNG